MLINIDCCICIFYIAIVFSFRNTIARLLPTRVQERHRAQESVPNYASILAAFEDQSRAHTAAANDTRGNGFGCGSVCIALSVVILVTLIMNFYFLRVTVKLNFKQACIDFSLVTRLYV